MSDTAFVQMGKLIPEVLTTLGVNIEADVPVLERCLSGPVRDRAPRPRPGPSPTGP